MQLNPEKEPAHFNYMETIAKNFIIPSRPSKFKQENVFNQASLRKIAVAMNTSSAVGEFFIKVRFLRENLNLFGLGEQLFH